MRSKTCVHKKHVKRRGGEVKRGRHDQKIFLELHQLLSTSHEIYGRFYTTRHRIKLIVPILRVTAQVSGFSWKRVIVMPLYVSNGVFFRLLRVVLLLTGHYLIIPSHRAS